MFCALQLCSRFLLIPYKRTISLMAWTTQMYYSCVVWHRSHWALLKVKARLFWSFAGRVPGLQLLEATCTLAVTPASITPASCFHLPISFLLWLLLPLTSKGHYNYTGSTEMSRTISTAPPQTLMSSLKKTLCPLYGNIHMFWRLEHGQIRGAIIQPTTALIF